MNYAYFKDPVLEFFILGICDKQNFYSRIENGLAQYPIQGMKAMMNLLGSHDTIRILELAKGNVNKLKLALLFQMTFIGAPHIYYGDEIAMLGGKDPDNRRPFNWKWEENPVAIDLREYYKTLIKLRLSNPLLIDGEFSFISTPEGLLAWRRYDENSQIDVVLNYGKDKLSLDFLSISEIILILGDIDQTSDSIILYPESGIVYNTY
jgi:glycosidase